MIYVYFNSAINYIKDGEHEKALEVLKKIERKKLGNAAKNLYDYYFSILKPYVGDPKLKHNETVVLGKNDLISKCDEREPKIGISLVSCCMNRNENLSKSLESWLKLPVDEIIIVDWSSSEPVSETISHIKDDRIKICRVDDEPYWVLTHGFNVGLRFASFSKIYKLDADIKVSEDFLVLNNFNRGEFVRGSWESALESGRNDQVFVNGSFGAFKEDLEKIGYYNEYITTYGWDDSDLYERLSCKRGLKTKYLSFNSLLHLEQEEGDRLKYQKVSNELFLDSVTPTEFNNSVNKFTARVFDFWEKKCLHDYQVKSVEDNIWSFRKVSSNYSLPGTIKQDAFNYAAKIFIWQIAPYLLNEKIDQNVISNFIYKEYNGGISLKETLKLLGFTDADVEFVSKPSGTSVEDFFSSCLDYLHHSEENIVGVIKSDELKSFNFSTAGGKSLRILYADDNVISYIKEMRFRNDKKTDIKPVSMSVSSRKIYIDAQHGLGNRLRAIASASAIAKRNNMDLVIVWEPDHHCECDFRDLFNYTGLVINSSFLNFASDNLRTFNYMEVEKGSFKDEEIVLSKSDVYLRSAYVFNSKDTSWDEENLFLKELEVSEEVRELVNSVPVNDSFVGAHVRMEAGKGLDNNTYDCVDNWTLEGHEQIHYWREKSHYKNFIKKIDALRKEGNDFNVFLAADLPETYALLSKKYPNNLFYLKRDVYDRSKDQLIYALADVILLSKCNKILGSNWSSFSELALRLSKNCSKVEMSGVDF